MVTTGYHTVETPAISIVHDSPNAWEEISITVPFF